MTWCSLLWDIWIHRRLHLHEIIHVGFFICREVQSEHRLSSKWLNVRESEPSQSWADELEAQILHTCDYFLLHLNFPLEWIWRVLSSGMWWPYGLVDIYKVLNTLHELFCEPEYPSSTFLWNIWQLLPLLHGVTPKNKLLCIIYW